MKIVFKLVEKETFMGLSASWLINKLPWVGSVATYLGEQRPNIWRISGWAWQKTYKVQGLVTWLLVLNLWRRNFSTSWYLMLNSGGCDNFKKSWSWDRVIWRFITWTLRKSVPSLLIFALVLWASSGGLAFPLSIQVLPSHSPTYHCGLCTK